METTHTLQVGCLVYFDVPLVSAEEVSDRDRQHAIAEDCLRGLLERVHDLPLISEDAELRFCVMETVPAM